MLDWQLEALAVVAFEVGVGEVCGVAGKLFLICIEAEVLTKGEHVLGGIDFVVSKVGEHALESFGGVRVLEGGAYCIGSCGCAEFPRDVAEVGEGGGKVAALCGLTCIDFAGVAGIDEVLHVGFRILKFA